MTISNHFDKVHTIADSHLGGAWRDRTTCRHISQTAAVITIAVTTICDTKLQNYTRSHHSVRIRCEKVEVFPTIIESAVGISCIIFFCRFAFGVSLSPSRFLSLSPSLSRPLSLSLFTNYSVFSRCALTTPDPHYHLFYSIMHTFRVNNNMTAPRAVRSLCAFSSVKAFNFPGERGISFSFSIRKKLASESGRASCERLPEK